MKTIARNPVQEKVTQLRKTLDLTQEETAHLLSVTTTTLSRWANKRTQRLDAAHETRLGSLLELLQEAREAIKPDGIAWWFKTAHPYLIDLRPIDLLLSVPGTQKVRSLLGAMRWGLPV